MLAGMVVAAAGATGWQFWSQRRKSDAAVQDDVCIVAPALRPEGDDRIASDGPHPIPADARCPVCGMYPARDPRWAAQIVYTDGAAHFFDSPVSLHLYLKDIARFGAGRSLDDIESRWVTDYDSGAWIDALAAFHVDGSDAAGPMRNGNLPAFATEAQAQAFAARHGGRVLSATRIDAPLLARLDTRARHPRR